MNCRTRIHGSKRGGQCEKKEHLKFGHLLFYALETPPPSTPIDKFHRNYELVPLLASRTFHWDTKKSEAINRDRRKNNPSAFNPFFEACVLIFKDLESFFSQLRQMQQFSIISQPGYILSRQEKVKENEVQMPS